MENHLLIANSAALATIVHYRMRHTGVFAEHFRRALDDGACECVCDLERLTDLTDLVEGAVHESPARAAAYKGRAYT